MSYKRIRCNYNAGTYRFLSEGTLWKSVCLPFVFFTPPNRTWGNLTSFSHSYLRTYLEFRPPAHVDDSGSWRLTSIIVCTLGYVLVLMWDYTRYKKQLWISQKNLYSINNYSVAKYSINNYLLRIIFIRITISNASKEINYLWEENTHLRNKRDQKIGKRVVNTLKIWEGSKFLRVFIVNENCADNFIYQYYCFATCFLFILWSQNYANLSLKYIKRIHLKIEYFENWK